MADLPPKIVIGSITRQFTVCCGVCQLPYSETAIGIDNFTESIDKNWRLTSEHGWIHKSCAKLMPTKVLFKVNT